MAHLVEVVVIPLVRGLGKTGDYSFFPLVITQVVDLTQQVLSNHSMKKLNTMKILLHIVTSDLTSPPLVFTMTW